MPRGYPDYNNPVYSLAMKNIDFGALLVGTVGLVPCDGRGRLYFLDTWGEGTYAWTFDGNGINAAYSLITTTPEIPPVNVLLTGGTGVGTGTEYCDKRFRVSGSNRLGIETGFRFGGVSPAAEVWIINNINTIGYRAILRIDSTNGELSVNTPSGQTVFDTSLGLAGTTSFFPMKLVCDFSTGYYIRAIFGDSEYDLSGYQIATPSGITEKEVLFRAGVRSMGLGNSQLYLGHIFITYDEP